MGSESGALCNLGTLAGRGPATTNKGRPEKGSTKQGGTKNQRADPLLHNRLWTGKAKSTMQFISAISLAGSSFSCGSCSYLTGHEAEGDPSVVDLRAAPVRASIRAAHLQDLARRNRDQTTIDHGHPAPIVVL